MIKSKKLKRRLKNNDKTNKKKKRINEIYK